MNVKPIETKTGCTDRNYRQERFSAANAPRLKALLPKLQISLARLSYRRKGDA